MKRLAVICARGGSKEIKNKNVRVLGGKPLLAHTVEQAQQSAMFDWIAVSSDSAEILQAGKDAGADYMIQRPAELANDVAPKIPAIRHCAASVEEGSGLLTKSQLSRQRVFGETNDVSPPRESDQFPWNQWRVVWIYATFSQGK